MKVLVAIDSSLYAEEVLKAVRERLWPQHCEIRVISAVEPCATSETEDSFVSQAQAILSHRVAELKRYLPKCGVSGDVIVGTAGHVITDTAGEWGADLIVLGSHGDTGPRKSRIGSVAASIVDRAPCTVELVKVHKLVPHDARANRGNERAAAASKRQ